MAAVNAENSMSSTPHNGADLESQKVSQPREITTSPTVEHGNEDDGLEDNSNVPRLSLLRLFWFFFYNFGLFSWGGPVT